MNRIAARAPRPCTFRMETDPEIVARYLEDAANYPGGHATGVVRPSNADEVAAAVAHARRVLPVGAQ